MTFFLDLKFSTFRWLFVFVLFSLQNATAQTLTGQLPLSAFGIGNSFGYGLSRNEALGSCGLASPSQDHVNLINPALLPYTEKVNLEIDLRYINRKLKVGDSYTYTGAGGGPAQLSISLPIHKKVTSAFGIRPNTNREFIYNQRQNIGSDSIDYRLHGSGGTSVAFLSTGVQVSPRFSLGLEVGYVFGTLEDSLIFSALPAANNFTFISLTKRRVGQVVFKPGIHYRHPIDEQKQTFLAFGATAHLGQKYQYNTYQTFVIRGSGVAPDVLKDGTSGSIKTPATYSFGVGYYRSLFWSLNLEGDYISGSNLSGADVAYKDGWALRLGGEISPGIKKSTQYFNIIMFRGGLKYTQFPFSVEGKSVSDGSVSLGASFPIIRKEAKFSRPLINLAVAYGRRGSEGTYLGMERYWLVTVGFTLNDFMWFNRRQID